MSMLRTREPAPALDLPLVGGGRFDLAAQSPETFTLVVFYRGLHCPQCEKQLKDLDSRLDDLAGVGVTSVVAVSGDDEQRATTTRTEWGIERLQIAHGLSEEQMRAWGLYVSKGVKEPEPDVFSEPAMVLVRTDGTVYSAHVQSTPFARPHVENLVAGIAFINENDYPARGEA